MRAFKLAHVHILCCNLKTKYKSQWKRCLAWKYKCMRKEWADFKCIFRRAAKAMVVTILSSWNNTLPSQTCKQWWQPTATIFHLVVGFTAALIVGNRQAKQRPWTSRHQGTGTVVYGHGPTPPWPWQTLPTQVMPFGRTVSHKENICFVLFIL